jgi:hypothetical protein
MSDHDVYVICPYCGHREITTVEPIIDVDLVEICYECGEVYIRCYHVDGCTTLRRSEEGEL